MRAEANMHNRHAEEGNEAEEPPFELDLAPRSMRMTRLISADPSILSQRDSQISS
mgnify:CR=1 FL=1